MVRETKQTMVALQEIKSSTANVKSSHVVWLWLVPVILVMFWLGARSLNADSIWYDEWWSIYTSGGAYYGPLSLIDVWNRIATDDPVQGPAYYMMLNVWWGFVGSTPAAGRALALLFGVLAMAWSYRLGSDIFSPRIGLYTAAIMATSTFFIYFLHELRVYTLIPVLSCITIWSYWRIITSEKPGRWPQVALLASVTLWLYLHNLAALTLTAIGLYHLLFVPRDWRWWRIVLIMLVGGLLFLPWVQYLIVGVISKEREPEAPNTALVPNLIYIFSNGVAVLLAAFALLSLRVRGRAAGFIWFLMIVLVILILLLNVPFKIHKVRYLMADWPLLSLIVALGMAQLTWMRIKPVLGLGVWMAVGLWMTADVSFLEPYANRTFYPFDQASAELRPRLQAGDEVIFSLPEGVAAVFRYEVAYYYMHGLDIRLVLFGVDSWYDQAMQFLEDLPLRLWIAYVEPTPLMTEFEGIIPAPYQLCSPVPTQSTINLTLYARSPVCCVPEAPPLLRFGDGIALTGTDPLPDMVTDSLPVLVGWSVADSVPPYTYSVALHILDGEDNLVAQADYGLSELAFSCSETPIDVASLPPGEYSLNVIVYAWESGQRLQGENVATGEQGERLRLGTFEVL